MPHVLTGRSLPALTLAATNGTDVALAGLQGRHVLCIYPRTSPPAGNTALVADYLIGH
jgi:peroxiredoxin